MNLDLLFHQNLLMHRFLIEGNQQIHCLFHEALVIVIYITMTNIRSYHGYIIHILTLFKTSSSISTEENKRLAKIYNALSYIHMLCENKW